MLKQFLILAFAGLLSHAHAAGIVPGFSTSTQYDKLGNVAPGCQLYVIQAGTVSTPQLAYQDSALTIPSPGGSKLTCDATGRLPQFFLADGLIKFRLTDGNGVQVFSQDGLLVVGPSSGGGGGGTVDPTTVIATGDIKTRYGTGVLTGFVRLNGRTIGSATSGATERANADVQPLFEYLWTADPNLTVSTGRGASASGDWVANKTITLPDGRGRMLAALDDMGNSSAGRLNAAASTTLGASTGNQSVPILRSNLPASTLDIFISDPGHSHGYTQILTGSIFVPGSGNPVTGILGADGGPTSGSTTGIKATSGLLGSGAALNIINPLIFVTNYIKL